MAMNVETAKYYTAPFVQLSPYLNLNNRGEKTGYMMKFLHVLQIIDNINVTLIPNADLLGAKVNNTWNGMLGMLQRNIIALSVGFVLLIYMTAKFNSKYGKVKSEIPFMFLLQCLLGTSPQSLNSSGVSRFLSVSWSLASFVLLVYLSSEMTSQFSRKSEALPFDTIDDVFHFPNAKPLLAKNSAYTSFVKKNALIDRAYAEVVKRADATADSCYQTFGTLTENYDIHSGIENRENFIIAGEVVLWNIIKARYARTGSCKIKLSQSLRTSHSVLYFKKNISQTLIKTINRRLRQFTEGDCFEDLNPSGRNEMHPCYRPQTTDAFVVINVSPFMAIFVVCLLGFCASLLTLVLEIYVHMLKVNLLEH